MLLQACLNGPLSKADHPAVPVSTQELAEDARTCVTAGAGSIHLHPRDSDGNERLDAGVIDKVVEKVRSACGVPISVSTGAWIEPDVGRRVELVRAWHSPDLATVNVCEEGVTEVMEALIQAGIGVEAGVWSVEDAERLAGSALSPHVRRILVEPVDVGAHHAVDVVGEIHEALDRLGLNAPRLQHGDGEATWVLVADAIKRGVATRVGFEDTLYGPDGDHAASNMALVRAARALGAG